MEDKKFRLNVLADLYWVFFKIGAVTFGGGMAMLPILERELEEKRHWTTSGDLLDYYAISQSTPGIIAVNVATFLGYKRAGIVGGVTATAGVVTPSVIIITIIAEFISNFNEIVWVQKALTGINVGVAALLTYTVINFARKSVKGMSGLVFFLAAFILIFVFNISSIWIIGGSALLGIAIAKTQGRLDTAPDDTTKGGAAK